ncbi:hypothetical protein GCM10009839_74920 [Catenulispora yoronensis]|uniref:Tetracycline repressor TetR C-terminal domain-containing protein n=1 Tax=Catenulispora yoronensis TaxID=450799 RepID=A0ABN2V8Q4_9ACTN
MSGRSHEIDADETILGILHRAGFRDAAAARVYHAFIDQTLAFAALDAASLALPDEAREADERQWRATYARLPAETHPHIAAAAPLLVARMNDSAYPAALDLLIAGAGVELEA